MVKVTSELRLLNFCGNSKKKFPIFLKNSIKAFFSYFLYFFASSSIILNIAKSKIKLFFVPSSVNKALSLKFKRHWSKTGS
jgi:hypothetical protein